MATFIEVNDAPTLDLGGFLDRVRSRLDPEAKDSALALAPDLAALARNPTFLADRLADSLQDWARFEPDNPYVFPCFVLGRGPGWMVRANYWRPAAEVGRGLSAGWRPSPSARLRPGCARLPARRWPAATASAPPGAQTTTRILGFANAAG